MEGSDSCTGDSGGPAFYTINGRDWLVGTVAFGSEVAASTLPSSLETAETVCGEDGRYGVQMKVSNYGNWIWATIHGESFQSKCQVCPCTGAAPSLPTGQTVSDGPRSRGVPFMLSTVLVSCSILLHTIR